MMALAAKGLAFGLRLQAVVPELGRGSRILLIAIMLSYVSLPF